MNTKIFENTRLCPKGDTEANWNKATGFVPLDKEIIIYKPDEMHSTARFKVGDGVTVVQDLPFAGADMAVIEQLINEKGELLIGYIDNAVKFLDEKTKDCPRTEIEWVEVINGEYTSEPQEYIGGTYGMLIAYDEAQESAPNIISITLDGIEYNSLVAQETPIGFAVGNLSKLNALAGTDYEDTGEPFCCGISNVACLIATDLTQSTTHNIVVYLPEETTVKLDKKYLPDGLATEEYVDEKVASIDFSEVDQVYNGTSQNAQSGVAVAEALILFKERYVTPLENTTQKATTNDILNIFEGA